MKPGHALAEDFRRIGVTLIIAAIIGGILNDSVPGVSAVLAVIVGIVLLGVGYWIHDKEERQ